MLDANGNYIYPWNHGETLTAASLNAAIAQNSGTGVFLPLSGGTVTGPLNVTATGATAVRSVQDRWGEFVSVKDFGARCDGTTDDTAAVNAAIAYVYGQGGGTVRFPHGTTLMLGAMVIPNNAAASNPRQNPLRLSGAGGSPDSYLNNTGATDKPPGGTVLDMRYGTTPDGTHLAKIDTRGAGLLEIENLTLLDGGTSNYRFLFTTNTTLGVRNVVFRGNQANTGQACVQDAVLLGGSALTWGDLTPTSAFQGYGTRFKDCFFNNIRTAIGFGSSANAVYVENCTIDASCGSSDAHGAPFMLLGQSNAAIGNVFIGCIVEFAHYAYAASFIGTNNQLNTFVGVGLYDQTGVTKAGFYFADVTSQSNVVLGCFTQGNIVNTLTDGPGAPYNLILHGRAISNIPWFANIGYGADDAKLTINGGGTNANDGATVFFANGGTTIGAIGNYSAIYGGAYNNTLTFYGAGHGIQIPTDPVTIGNGTAIATLAVNGGSSGANTGPMFELLYGGTQRTALAAYSAFFGGAYNSQTVLSGYDGLNFVTANVVGASLDTAHNFTVTGQVTATSMRCTGGAGPTWSAGVGVPAATLPVGSLYSRTDGAVGSTLYVSRGGGTWAAVAGV